MTDLHYKDGDTYPPLLFVDECGTPLDLRGFRVTCTYRRHRDRKTITRPLRILDTSRGEVRPPTGPTWPLDTPMQLLLHWPDGSVESPLTLIRVEREL